MQKRIAALVALGLAVMLTLSGAFMYHAQASTEKYVILPDNTLTVATGTVTVGAHPTSSRMPIVLVLRAQHEDELNTLLANLYNPKSSSFHHWLAKGQYAARFAPSSSQIAQVQSYLRQGGLTVGASSSPFLIRASGTTAQVDGLFRTQIKDYKTSGGQSYFSNDHPVSIPASLSSLIAGVMGLRNSVRAEPQYITTRDASKTLGRAVPHYGLGPGGSGLTPSQTSSIYGAAGVYATGAAGQGAGRTLAVFELSGYTRSDITHYEHTFFGSGENVGIADVNVDGGPIHPVCPLGDICNPPNDYSGDIEVEADIQQQIALDPKTNGILVYNAPNDFFGVTEVDEYTQIANDDFADSISSSWALCEQDAGVAEILAEENAFRQMAVQGQSMFAASGDTGAYACLRGSGNPALAVLDPASDPYVVSVGGTSFGTYDPGSITHPSYPTGFETVWNPLGLCRPGHLGDCANFGAGGGGNSVVWGRPGWQHGPGVVNSFNTHAPSCLYNEYRSSLPAGFACREAPDVSANADEFTPYAEFCTGSKTTNSLCATFSSGQPVPGWFGIGGTSLSSPVWSAIIGLWDSFHHARYGNASEDLYQDLFSQSSRYTTFYHDITGINQQPNNNGFFPVTPNYDEATGIGTPRITGIAESHE